MNNTKTWSRHAIERTDNPDYKGLAPRCRKIVTQGDWRQHLPLEGCTDNTTVKDAGLLFAQRPPLPVQVATTSLTWATTRLQTTEVPSFGLRCMVIKPPAQSTLPFPAMLRIPHLPLPYMRLNLPVPTIRHCLWPEHIPFLSHCSSFRMFTQAMMWKGPRAVRYVLYIARPLLERRPSSTADSCVLSLADTATTYWRPTKLLVHVATEPRAAVNSWLETERLWTAAESLCFRISSRCESNTSINQIEEKQVLCLDSPGVGQWFMSWTVRVPFNQHELLAS